MPKDNEADDAGQPQIPRGELPAFAGAEALVKFWTSWMQGHSSPSSDAAAGSALASGVRQLNDAVRGDPVLRAVDQVWNANPLRQVIPVDWAEIVRALRTVWLRSLAKPGEAASAALDFNLRAWNATMDAWQAASRRWLGVAPPQAERARGGDKRFNAPEWETNPIYQTMRDVYLLASDWLLRHADTLDMDPVEKQRVNFHLRQFIDAVSPSLMLISNPVALRQALATGGTSLADGARNLLSDLQEGRLSMVDATAFAPGRNLALSPGKVVLRNKLIELIQYSATTESTHAIPIILMPPWINKFYILDMQPKNSLVAFLVSQGFTVFVVSWKNPDASMDTVGIEDYIELGPLAAADAARDITGAPTVNIMGYCIGGTLLALTLAWLAARGESRFNAATFIVSLQDFAHVGDTAIFMGEDKFDIIEQQMLQRGYLDSTEMANMFNLLRANDLIWANVVNNYLLGQKPPAFDLLYWNSDGTRMTRVAHSWYLQNTYIENNIIVPDKVTLKGEPLDLGKITLDVYAIGAEKDHIVPWDSAWRITQLVGGNVRFVLASSGHIAGIINPPGGKGTYWVSADETAGADTAAEWRAAAPKHEGSWWPDWAAWLAARSGPVGPLPALGSANYPMLEDAPGTYVLER